MKRLFLFLLAVTGLFAANKMLAVDDLPKNGRVIHYEPFSSSVKGPFYDVVSRKATLQTYNPATGELKEYKQEKPGFFDEDERGFKLDSCLMFDRDLKLSRNGQLTIAVCFLSNYDATTRGPLALMRSGQPDSLWYFPISVEKNRMIYMEGRPAPDSAVVKSRWHYKVEGGMKSTVFIQIDLKTGRHEIYMRDSASVFYNDALSQMAELPNRIVFTPQEGGLVHEFAVYNRFLTMKEMQYYYTGKMSKDYAEKHQMKAPLPIVGNIDEASGVVMHGWSWTRWGWTIGMLALIAVWLIRRFRNIKIHYSFAGSPLIILAGIFGTWYLQTVKDFDVEYLWIFNTVQLLAYYLVSFRADPLYSIRNAGGVGSVVNYVGGIFGLLSEILDSIPTSVWEVTYVNRSTGEETKKTETRVNLLVVLFWVIVIGFVIWAFIILAEIVYVVLPIITIYKFVSNYFKEHKDFKQAKAASAGANA